MGVLLGLMKTHTRSQRGEKFYTLKSFYRKERSTLTRAITRDRHLAMKTILKGINGQDFKQFLWGELAPKLWSQWSEWIMPTL